MDVQSGSFFSVYYLDTGVSLQSHDDKVVKWKSNKYRYDLQERCDLYMGGKELN